MSFKISIITICRNIATTIERTLKSIVNQSFQNFEWIVVDGNSDDGTYEIIQKYSSRINTLIHEPDNGIYNAMNKGINNAHGDYLLFLNGGDELFNTDSLSLASIHLQKYPLVLFNIYLKNADNTIEWIIPPKIDLYPGSIPHNGTFISKKLFQKYGYYNESFKICADHDFFAKMIEKHKVEYSVHNLFISVFYLDGISITNKKLTEKEDIRIKKKYYPLRFFLDNHFFWKKVFCKLFPHYFDYLSN